MAEKRASTEGAANWVLAALPPKESRRLLPNLEPVALAHGEVLHEVGEPIRHVYFPGGGLVSLLAPLNGAGKVTEVGIVGKEGVLGLSVFLGGGPAYYRAVVQGSSQALRVSGEALLDLVRRCPTLAALLARYAGALLHQVAQSAVCNCHHPLSHRLGRWLLMAHDRLELDLMPFTQKFLAMILTVRLATVSEAASEFQRAGLIRYHRGHVEVLDRAALEAASCGCYRLIKERLDRLAKPIRC